MQLLEELQAGTRSYKSLHPEDKMLLDAAAAEALMEPVARKKAGRVVKPEVKKKLAEAREETIPTGPDNLPAFWWV